MLQYNNSFIFFSLLYIFILFFLVFYIFLLKTFKQLLLQKYHLFFCSFFFSFSFPVFSLMPTRQTLHPCSLSEPAVPATSPDGEDTTSLLSSQPDPSRSESSSKGTGVARSQPRIARPARALAVDLATLSPSKLFPCSAQLGDTPSLPPRGRLESLLTIFHLILVSGANKLFRNCLT